MLSEALRLIRVFHDLSQKELAEKLGVSKSYISELEAGNRTPTLATLERYAEEFHIPLSSILFFSENIDAKKRGEGVRTAISSKVISMMNLLAERYGRADDDPEGGEEAA